MYLDHRVVRRGGEHGQTRVFRAAKHLEIGFDLLDELVVL